MPFDKNPQSTLDAKKIYIGICSVWSWKTGYSLDVQHWRTKHSWDVRNWKTKYLDYVRPSRIGDLNHIQSSKTEHHGFQFFFFFLIFHSNYNFSWFLTYKSHIHSSKLFFNHFNKFVFIKNYIWISPKGFFMFYVIWVQTKYKYI